MTTYIYAPLCPIPAPVSTGGNGNTDIIVWGAGIRAGSYAIRVIAVEFKDPLLLWRVDSATLNNSTSAPTITPIAARQGASAPSCTTAMGTVRILLSGSTYSYPISGTVPTGTFNYLGITTAGRYTPPSDLIISPGSAFWIGSDITAVNITIGGTPLYAFNGNQVANTETVQGSSPIQQKKEACTVFFEELHLARST